MLTNSKDDIIKNILEKINQHSQTVLKHGSLENFRRLTQQLFMAKHFDKEWVSQKQQLEKNDK